MVKSIQRDRKIAAVERDIAATEADIDNRNRVMSAEIDGLRRRKQFANNNLAGATYEQSLSSEMQAVAAKYKAMNDVDLERVRQLRATLATLKSVEK